jgi:hypothetical protein
MAACRTPGVRSPFRSSDVRHDCKINFVYQVVNVFAIFPLTHALVVMPPQAALSHAVRIADEDLRDAIDLTEVDGLPRPLVVQIVDAPLRSRSIGIVGFLQPAIAT